jgi:3-mercaptopyruvate sulfurtransferase SseA
LAGCNSNELSASKTRSGSAPCTPSAAVVEPRRITVAELKDDLEKGSAILIDVRGEAAYKAAHIKGSRQIPYAEIANHSDELPLDKLIATYCS